MPDGPMPYNANLNDNARKALIAYSNLASQISNILVTLADLKQREANHAYSTIYQNISTYTVNADGTIGATDTDPNHDHPMTGSYVTSNQVSGFVGYVVNDLYNFLTGVSGPAVADRRPAIYGILP